MDDDALFEGKLVQTAATNEAVTRFVTQTGRARKLDELLGKLKKAIDEVADLLLALAPEAVRENEFRSFIESIRINRDKADLRRRLITLRFINRMTNMARSLLGANASMVDYALGLHRSSLEALEHGAVHVLPRGTLEHHYRATDVADCGISSEEAKRKAFEAERNRLFELDRVDIDAEYTALIAVLDAACGSLVVDVIPLLAELLGDWIHRAQIAWRQGRLNGVTSFQSMLTQGTNRILEVVNFDATSTGFICRIRLAEIIDPARRCLTFDQETVPSSLIETLADRLRPFDAVSVSTDGLS